MFNGKKVFIVVFLALLLGGYLVFRYVYKDHRDISSEKISFELTLNDLDLSYKNDAEDSNLKFLDKTISVVGFVTSVDEKNRSLLIDGKINCSLIENIDNSKNLINSRVNIKGRFIGYDELLEEYKLDECTLVSQ